MTVQNNETRDQDVATAGQTVFTYGFEIAAAANIAIYKRAGTAEPDDAADLLAYPGDYTLSGIGFTSGGTYTLTVPAALGDILTAESIVPASRSTSFTTNGVAQAANLNTEFDNQTLIEQRILTLQTERTPTYAASARIEAGDLVLPTASSNTFGAGTMAIWAYDTDLDVWQLAEYNPNDDVAAFRTELASHDTGEGASMVGLHPSGTVQDFANASFILKTANATAPNAQILGSLGTGILKSTTVTGVLSISAILTTIDALTLALGDTLYASAANVISKLSGNILGTKKFYSQTGTGSASAAPAWSTISASDIVSGQALTKTDDTNVTVTFGGAFATALLATASMTLSWTGQLSMARGGTGANLTAVDGGLVYTTGSAMAVLGPVSVVNRILMSGASTFPGWSNAVYPSSTSAKQILYSSSDNVIVGLTMNVNSVVVTDGSGNPSTSTTLPTAVQDNITRSGTFTTGTWSASTIAVNKGGTGSTTAAGAATNLAVLALAGGTMAGDIDMGGFKITDAADPTISSDYATKNYVDNLTQNVQTPVLVSTTANLTGYIYSNGASGVGATLTGGGVGAFTADGVTPALNSRILVGFQTSGLQNGVYTLTTTGSGIAIAVLTRATDYDTTAEIQSGDKFTVLSGTLYGGATFLMNQAAAVTVGVTDITWFVLDASGALLKANNLSDLMSVSSAQSNLSLSPGVDVQVYSVALTSIAALTTAADKIIYATGSNTFAVTDLSSFARTLLDDTSSSVARATLSAAVSGANSDITALTGVTGAVSKPTSITLATTAGIRTDTSAGNTYLLQAYDVDGAAYTTFVTLTANNTPTMDLADAVTKAGAYIYRVGGTDISVADGGTGSSTASDARTALGVAIGSDVQGYNSNLAALASLISAADKLPYFTGSGTAAVTDITSFARSLLDDTTAGAARTTLGITTPTNAVIQIVNTETGAVSTASTAIPADDTIPQITEGTQYMSLAITPTNASNILTISVVFNGAVNGSTNTMTCALFQDATSNALAAAGFKQSAPNLASQVCFTHKMVAGTTSATTFRVRGGLDNASDVLTFNGVNASRVYGGVMASSITITEYSV